MADEGGEMVHNLEIAQSESSCTAAGPTAAAPSCYRVSVVSGSLEVSARLKSADDLELLLKVLEANKTLFTKADPSQTEAFAKANGSEKKTSANADLTEILTL